MSKNQWKFSLKSFNTIGQALVCLNPGITAWEKRSGKEVFFIDRIHYAYHYFRRTKRGTGLAELSLILENRKTGWLREIIGREQARHLHTLGDLLKNEKVRSWFQRHKSLGLQQQAFYFKKVRNDSVHEAIMPSEEEIERAFYIFLQIAELYFKQQSINLFDEPKYLQEFKPGTIICERFKVVKCLGGNNISRTYKVVDILGHNAQFYTVKWVSIFAENYDSIINNETQERPLFNDNPNIGKFYSSHEDVPVGGVLLLEYIDGCILEQWVTSEWKNKSDSAKIYQFVYAIGGVLNALKEIHNRGYVHGNVTSRSIIITRNTKDARLVSFDKCTIANDITTPQGDIFSLGKTMRIILEKSNLLEKIPNSLKQFISEAVSDEGYADANVMYEQWLNIYNDIRYDPKKDNKYQRVALISCSNRKKIGTFPAEELYSESPNFCKALSYAKDPNNEFSKIHIVSGRYGVVDLRQSIPNYNVDLRQMTKDEQIAWATQITAVLKTMYTPGNCSITILADDVYTENLMYALDIAGFDAEGNSDFFQATGNNKNKNLILEGNRAVFSSDDFRKALYELLDHATGSSIEISSGELHRLVGGYPGKNHRMPICCQVMRQAIGANDEILYQPPSGLGASLLIKYKLPR